MQHKIINIFGSKVTNNNKLNIKKLAEVAFSNKVDQNILNGIMWAEVFILINNKIEECEKNKISLFIVDAAMIFEAKLNNFFDTTLLVTADKKIRLKRAEKRHNISLEQIKNRMSLQLSESKKEKHRFVAIIEKAYNEISVTTTLSHAYTKNNTSRQIFLKRK